MRWLKILPFIFWSSFVYGENGSQKVKPIYDFSKGLDTYHSSLSLPDGYVQSSLNGFFDAQTPFSKRSGFSVAFSSKTYAGQQMWNYTDPTNTSWIIVRTSDTIIANNLSGSATVKVATVSVNNLIGETNAFGFAYFVDQTQGVYYWNGSSVTFVGAASPLGSLITTFHNRLFVSGAAVPNGNQVYGSALYDGTKWTTGLNPNDPVQITAGLQDNYDNVTALYVFLDTLYVGKHFSIYGLYGFDQTNFQISQITQECGIVDQNTIQNFGGDLKFASLRGVEDFNGYTCTRISGPVKNLVDPAIQSGGFASQSWVQSQTADWTAGTLVQLDTTTSAPALEFDNGPSTTVVNNSFENGNTGWTFGSNWSNVTTVGPATPTCNYPPYDGTHMAQLFESNGDLGVVASIVYSTNTSFIISSGTFQTTPPGCGWILNTLSYNATLGSLVKIVFQDFLNNGDKLTSNAFYPNNTPIQWRQSLDYDFSIVSPPYYKSIDLISGATVLPTNYSSGTFKSQVHQISSMGTWGNFSSVQNLSGGTIAFSICSSTNSNMSIPLSCASQAANSQITVSTGVTGNSTYVQWFATFTVTTSTQTAVLNSGTVQWFSGSKAVPMASTVWDNRYWLSLTTTTADSANDAVLVLSSKGSWGLLDIHAGGFAQYKGSLYHSDSLPSGNVYLDNSGTTDNGKNINTYLITKDFKSDDLNADNYFNSIYMSMDSGSSNCQGTVSYFLDHNETNPFTLSTVQQSEFANSISLKIPFALGTNQNFGHTIAFEYQENDSCPMNLYGFSPYFFERPVQ